LEIIHAELMQKWDYEVSLAKILSKKLYGTEKYGQFIVHCIAWGNHSKDSKHKSGEAGDGHHRGLNLYQTVMLMMKAGFTGIGIYPEWAHPGVHGDIRKQDHISTWIGYYLKDHNGDYIIGDDGHRIQRYNYDFKDFMDVLLEQSGVE